MKLNHLAPARPYLIPRQGWQDTEGQADAVRRIEGPDLILVRLDVDRAFAADATVALRQQSGGNQFPAKTSKQDGSDEATNVLQDASTDDQQTAVAPQTVLEEPNEYW